MKLTMQVTLVGTMLMMIAVAWAADDTTKARKIPFVQHSGYFESNKSGLKGDASYLALSSEADFKKLFGMAVVMGARAKFLPKNAFATKMVVATIKRGNRIYTYKVEDVTEREGVLTVRYSAEGKEGGTAKFASPLILSLDKGNYKRVVFVENGKEVGAATIGKE